MTDARAKYEQHLEKGHVPPELLPPPTEEDLQRDAAFDEMLALVFSIKPYNKFARRCIYAQQYIAVVF